MGRDRPVLPRLLVFGVRGGLPRVPGRFLYLVPFLNVTSLTIPPVESFDGSPVGRRTLPQALRKVTSAELLSTLPIKSTIGLNPRRQSPSPRHPAH